MKEFIEKLISRLEELRIDKSNYFGVLNIVAEKYDRANEMLDDSIEIVKELAEEYKYCTKPCTDCEAYDLVKHHCPKFCNVIKETVEEVKENYNNGWIPCSERLPDKEGTYLVTLKKWETITFARFTDIKTNPHFNALVIAWMPLPQPYTEEQKELSTTWQQQTMNRFERVE